MHKAQYISVVIVLFLASVIGGLGMSKYQSDKTKLDILLQACTLERIEWQNAYTNLSQTNLVDIILKLQPRLDPVIAKLVEENTLKYSAKFRLPPRLIIHIIHRESRFNPLARSSIGAVGLMQINIKAHKDKLKQLGISAEEAYRIDNNIHLGCWIFREYFNETNDVEKTLTKYVGGNHDAYIKDILTGFTNEAIVGVKDVQRVREADEGESDVETSTESERSGEHEEEPSNAQDSSQSAR